jgi:uncharacterized membrane-anchored protein YitT (DUF2179 family)
MQKTENNSDGVKIYPDTNMSHKPVRLYDPHILTHSFLYGYFIGMFIAVIYKLGASPQLE